MDNLTLLSKIKLLKIQINSQVIVKPGTITLDIIYYQRPMTKLYILINKNNEKTLDQCCKKKQNPMNPILCLMPNSISN